MRSARSIWTASSAVPPRPAPPRPKRRRSAQNPSANFAGIRLRTLWGPRPSKPEGEFRILAHPLGRPGRRERHHRMDLLDSLELAHELLDLLGDLGADRAAGAGQGVCDAHRATLE